MPALRSNRNSFALAYDRAASVRTISKDGRLHVAISNISKATVSPYHCTEIPRWRELGLDPDRTYQFLRDPDELEKAVPSFNNLPLLNAHSPVTAANHSPDLVIGATGSDAKFEAPYLKNSLVIWAKDAIDAVESGEQREISCGYYWTADMTPGVFNGERFDGVMRNIIGSHVALVAEGRAGPDVLVADSKEELSMHKLSRKAAVVQGALLVHLQPIMAQDAKADLTPYLVGVTGRNFKASRAAILAGVRRATAGKLAVDAVLDLDAVGRVLETLEDFDPAEEDDAPPPVRAVKPSEPDAPAVDEDPLARIKEFLKGKISDEDLADLDSFYGAGANDGESPEVEAARLAKIRSDAKRDRESIEKPEKGAEVVEKADQVEKAEHRANDERRRAAERGYASRYPNSPRTDVLVRSEQPRALAMDRRSAAPPSSAVKSFSGRYPEASRIQKL
jgi:hypothetical protein